MNKEFIRIKVGDVATTLVVEEHETIFDTSPDPVRVYRVYPLGGTGQVAGPDKNKAIRQMLRMRI